MNASATQSGIESFALGNAGLYSSVMDREKFVLKEAKRGGWLSAEEFLTYHEVTTCDCGKAKCKGWQVRWKFGAQRRREGGSE